VANLCSVLKEVEWDSMGLDVPFWRGKEIEEKTSNDLQCKQALLEEWRNHHPAPSWMLVAKALYDHQHHKALQLVKEKYLKCKEILSSLCNYGKRSM